MANYSSKTRRIRDAVVTTIAGIQLNGSVAFQIATSDPRREFDAEPFALVFPGDINSETVTTGQRDRTVNFEIMILLNMEDESRTQSQTYDFMYDLTELVMSTLEESDFHSSLNQVDPTIGVYMTETSRGSFIPAETKGGSALLCTINIAIRYAIDL